MLVNRFHSQQYFSVRQMCRKMCLELNALVIYLLTALVLQCLQFAKSEIVYPPLNAAVASGEPVDMNCSVNPESHSIIYCIWEFSLPGSIEESTIYTTALGMDKSVTSFEMRHQSNSSCDLIAKDVQLRDAGLYICNIRVKNTINGFKTIMRHSAQLVVIDSNPPCIRDRDDIVKRRCSVIYRGNWPPVIEWRGNDGQTIPGAMTYDVNGISISNTLDDKVDSAHICVIHFSTYSGNISMTAGNTPGYMFVCPTEPPVVGLPQPNTTTSGSTSKNITAEYIATGVMSCLAVLLTGILIWVSVSRCKENRMERSKEPLVLPLRAAPAAPAASVEPPPAQFQSISPIVNVMHIAPRTQGAHVAPAHTQQTAPSLLSADQETMMQNDGIQRFGAGEISQNLNCDSINPDEREVTVHHPQYERVEYATIDHTVLLLHPPPPVIPPR